MMPSRVIKKIQRIVERNVIPALQQAIEDIHFESFKQQGYFEGKGKVTPWKPLSPDYAQRKRGSKRILTQTGALRNSLQTQKTATGIKATANVTYASQHNEGTGNTPQRQFQPLGDNQHITREVDRVLQEAFNRIK